MSPIEEAIAHVAALVAAIEAAELPETPEEYRARMYGRYPLAPWEQFPGY